MDREKVIRIIDELIFEAQKAPTWKAENALRYLKKVLLKEQEAEIERLKRPDCEHANRDGAGCLGYCGCEQDDEPIDACKQCEKYTGNICAEY